MYSLKNIILFSLIAANGGMYAMENTICEALFDACEQGDLNRVKVLCKCVENINNVVRKRDIRVMQLQQFAGGLVLFIPSLHQKKETLLGFACEKGQFAIVKYLVEKKKADVEVAGIDFQHRFKDVPLLRASSKEIKQYLFEHGADPYLKSLTGGDEEYFSFNNFKKPVVVAQAAIERGYNVNRLSATGMTPLMKIGDNIGLTECFINNGADVNFQDDYGLTPLFLANEWGNYNVGKLLISKGARLSFEGKHQKNIQFVALVTALYHTNIDFFNYFLKEENIDINVQFVDGHTVLHDIASRGFVDHAKKLGLRRKRKIELSNRELVVFLLCKGADPRIKNLAGKLPFECAKYKQIKKVLETEESVRKAIIECKFKSEKPIVVPKNEKSVSNIVIENKRAYENAVCVLRNRELTGHRKLLSDK